MSWYDAGVTEQNLLPEGPITPIDGGHATPLVVQQAGFIRKIRGFMDVQIDQSAATAAPTISDYGPLGSFLKRIQVLAAGRKPFFSMSGYGLTIYNEVCNPDASVFAVPAIAAGFGLDDGASLVTYTAPGTGAQTYHIEQPFELPFSIPIWLTNVIRRGDVQIPAMVLEEVGLWYLQERKTQLTIETEWYGVDSVAATPKAPYCDDADLVATLNSGSRLYLERELLSVPRRRQDWPSQAWVHQVIEHSADIAGKQAIFPVPQVGALLRAIIISLDSDGAPVEWTDVDKLSWEFGASDKPIERHGRHLVQDYITDYDRQPPKGVVVLDFWKAGRYANQLARNTDLIANLKITTDYTATTTGKQLIILESLVPQVVGP